MPGQSGARSVLLVLLVCVCLCVWGVRGFGTKDTGSSSWRLLAKRLVLFVTLTLSYKNVCCVDTVGVVR